ncbi:OsmC family protein [Nonomuraea sp. NPDC023979]|uniref:OsmC family protein n=1 Tax=unclassified Nonomuraea TaxID=2593643 RepID=UPI0033DB033E
MIDSSTVAEIARVSVEAAPGRTKLVTVPLDGQVPMGMHGGVAEHYNVPLDTIEPHATTLDYLVGATAGCLTGTLSGLLGRLGQPTTDGALTSEAEGIIVKDGGVLRIASVHVRYLVRLAEGVDPDEVARAHDRHTRHCPIARTIGDSVEITTTLETV